MLGDLVEGPRAQDAIDGVLKTLVNAPADFSQPEIRQHKADLSLRTKKEGPAPDVRQKKFPMAVHGQPDATKYIAQGRKRALRGDIPEGKPTMPKVLEAVVLIVAVEAVYRTLKKKEARICR